MSRENFDIPEVFRKAMEEVGWDRDSERDENGGDGGERPPFPRRPTQPQRPSRLMWLLGLLFLLLLSLNWIVNTYTEWLWFRELGYQSVWLKQWGVQVISFIIFFVLAAALLLVNWHLARRRVLANTPPNYPQFMQFPGFNWLINGVALFFAFVFASAGAAQWEEFLLFLNRVVYNVSDPIFGRDISFYFFELPIYQFLRGWFSSILLISLLGTLLLYVINFLPDLQRGRWQKQATDLLLRHVAGLAAVFLLLWAVDHGLDIFNLMYSRRGVVTGASYTDMNATLYALWAQMILMTLTAVAVAINVLRLSIRPVILTGGLWLIVSFVLGGIYPGLLQRYAVEPNEIVRETPFIEHNIRYTQMAYGLDKIETRPFDYGPEISQEDFVTNAASLNNVRLSDYRPLQDTYEQLQALRTYYQFGEIDIDRYTFDGETRQVMLAVRELNKSRLPAPSWVNQNLEFTHGYGLVMNPVDKVTADGQPEFYVKDLPPVASVPLEITRPEIYYGEMTDDVVFVGSDRDEFSYPSGDENVYTSYEGLGGVPLDSALKRLAFAMRLADTNVLLSDEISRETRVQYHRQIEERVSEITPFLQLDADPYIVVSNGRLVWLMDAYTISNRFPFATAQATLFGNINYIRNAVKITVDAYDGNVNFYITAPDDPIIQSYDRAFPGLFQPLSAMPEGLLSHLRYPEDLFTIQVRQYLTYHMTDVRVFYNKEDLREIPNEIYEGDQIVMEPYYVTLPLPGEEAAEYLLIQPLTPATKSNMVAWIAARNDPEFYGELVEYELPKQELVFGPIQVESRIDQEPTISEQFSLWNQQGSRVIRGNLIVIPFKNSFLYVEPVYLRSETSALPQLKRVIVATNQRIVMRDNLEDALAALIQASPAVSALEVEPGVVVPIEETEVSVGDAAPGSGAPVTPISADAEALINAANAHFEAAEAAQRAGDWTTYGNELAALEQSLQQLLELSQETSP